MMFDVRLMMKERQTGVITEVVITLQVDQTAEGYKAFNPLASSIIGTGATPQAALLNYLNQQLHSVEALAFHRE